ncbi:MAG: hypothetical protein PHD40_05675 [Syntrophomonadaceae bacterium]|nr:hypothetical protein [Syntrophomonadaceae bacterium]
MNSNIAQIMESIQGEGLLAGTRQVFIRLFVSRWISLTGGEPPGQEHMSEIN